MASYLPPTENLPIFDDDVFIQANDTALTYNDAKKYFLAYPQAQGTESLLDVNVAGTLTASSNIKYADNTTQNSAYTGAGTLSGSYSNTNISVDSNGKITALSSGTGGITSFTISSNAVGTNSWTFTIPNSYGRAFNYSLFSDTTPSVAYKTQLGNPMNYGTPALNNSFVYATGAIVYQPYNGTSSTRNTYCSGFSQNYTISAGGGAYIPSVINSMGGSFTWTLTTSNVSENTANCPPTAATGFTTIYSVSCSSSVASCYLKLVGVVVAS